MNHRIATEYDQNPARMKLIVRHFREKKNKKRRGTTMFSLLVGLTVGFAWLANYLF